MAARRVLKLFLWGLATPLCILSLLLERLVSGQLRSDLERCVEVTDQFGCSVPATFVDAVILAEDHRNELHPGIDVFAMARAVWARLRRGQIQGASTIEQQFVRVVTNRHEKTVRRKVREQVLALMLVRRAPKRQIASAYLAVAFYGSGSVGLCGLARRFGRNLERVPHSQALGMVAQLKYPRPGRPSKEWSFKLRARIQALHRLGAATTCKSLQQTIDPHAILLAQDGTRLKRR